MKKESTPLVKGMFTQASPKQQPKGTWNFALNALFGSWDGDASSITNEVGNEICINYSEDNYTLIGAQILPDNKFVLFFTNDTDSIIGIHDPMNCDFAVSVKTNCIGFKSHRQLTTRARIVGGCERIVYFTDGITSYKALNLDNLDSYLALDSNGNPLFTIDTANLGTNYLTAWNCDKFNHFLSFNPGCLKLEVVRDAGGSIPSGSHQFVMRYLDSQRNGTNWSPASYPIFVYTESTNSNIADGESIDTITNKSIKLNLTDLDPTFRFVQLAVLSAIQGTSNIDEVFILDSIPIVVDNNIGTAEYTYLGFDSTSHTISSLSEVTVPIIPFTGVRAHEIIDNRLLLGNVANLNEDLAVLQRTNLRAKTKWRMYKDYVVNSKSPNVGQEFADRNSVIIFDGKTHMRDEIISLGTVFVLNNGTELPAVHTPGRPLNEDFDGNDLTPIANLNSRNIHISRGNLPLVNRWDDRPLTITPDAEIQSGDEDTRVGYSNVTHLLDTLACTEVNETSAKFSTTFTVSLLTGSTGEFTLALDTNDRALVRITILGGGDSYFVDTTFKFLTTADNTLGFSYNDVSKNIMCLQIFYYDSDGVSTSGNTVGVSYHEITGGSRVDVYVAGGNVGLFLNESSFDFLDCTAIPRWKVHNTFVTTGTNTDTTIEGYMGYYEHSNNIYTTNKDCSGVPVFDATSIGGANLVGQPIRHHRIPDCGGDAGVYGYQENQMGLTTRDWVTTNNIPSTVDPNVFRRIALNKIGLIVDMTEVYANMPTKLRNSIRGHYIVYGKRTPENKTIIDKGYMWRNNYVPTFYTRAFALANAGGYARIWFPEIKFNLLTGFFTYDFALLPGLPGVPPVGRIREDSYTISDGIRADISFTSSLPTYDGYGYSSNPDFRPDIGFSASDNDHFHGTESNFVEYVSPSTVFDLSVPSGDFIKIECPVMSYHPSNLTANSGERELFVVQQVELELGDLLLGRTNYYDSYTHCDFNHVAVAQNLYSNSPGSSTTLIPTDLAYLGFQREIRGAAIVPWHSIGGAAQFSIPTQLTTDSFGQVASFYQTKLPFPMVMNPALSQVSDIIYGYKKSSVDDAQDALRGHSVSNFYVSIKNNTDVFGFLENITYLRLNTCFIPRTAIFNDELIKGGDTFITKVRNVKTWSKISGDGDYLNNMKSNASSMEGFVESDNINSSLAHSAVPESEYAPKYFDRFTHLNVGRSGSTFNKDTLWSDVELTNTTEVSEANFGYREFKYDYNKDFGKQNNETPSFPVSDNYNYCDDCSGREPNSIYYSIPGQAQDIADNFKIILPNNKFPIPSESGPITAMFLEKDQLYVHTEKALFSVQTRPQQLDSNAATIFIGTGQIGSIPPQRLVSVQYGYGGSGSQYTVVGTQYGTFYVDEAGGRIFLFGKGLNEVSKLGMEQWFHSNLSLEFINQFYMLTAGIEYTVRGTSTDNSVGFQAVYDARMNRIVLHKKDYLIRATDDDNNTILFGGYLGTLPVSGVVNTLYAIFDEFDYIAWHYWNGSEFVEIGMNDTAWFENKSWTMSYSLDGNFWVSFHSYQPNYMYHDNTNFYSFINRTDNNTVVWKHIERNFQTYYGVKYDHIIDISLDQSPATEKVYYSTQFVTDSYIYEADSDYSYRVEDVTFDRFYVYNGKQCSNLRNLIVKIPNSYQNITLPLTQTLIDRTENYWRFNRFRDEVTNGSIPFFTSNWSNLQTSFNTEGQGYLDRVINPLSVDGTKSIYKQARFRDKYVAVRLFFNNTDADYKIKTEIMTFLTNLSIR